MISIAVPALTFLENLGGNSLNQYITGNKFPMEYCCWNYFPCAFPWQLPDSSIITAVCDRPLKWSVCISFLIHDQTYSDTLRTSVVKGISDRTKSSSGSALFVLNILWRFYFSASQPISPLCHRSTLPLDCISHRQLLCCSAFMLCVVSMKNTCPHCSLHNVKLQDVQVSELFHVQEGGDDIFEMILMETGGYRYMQASNKLALRLYII